MRRRVGLRQLGPYDGAAVVLLEPLVVLAARRRWLGTAVDATTMLEGLGGEQRPARRHVHRRHVHRRMSDRRTTDRRSA